MRLAGATNHSRSRAALLIFTLGSVLVSWELLRATTSNSVGGSSSEIEGTWKGVYFTYPNIMAVKLSVRTLPMDHIEGECEISQATPSRFHNAGDRCNYRFTGLYTPWAKEFAIKPGQAIAPGNMAQQRMSGVLDLSGDRLAGFVGNVLNSQPPVVLAHGEKGEQLVADALASAYPPTAPRAPVPWNRRQAPDAAETEKLAKWASRLETEFPKLELRHTQMQDLNRLAQNVFRDDWFRQFFGTTFDKLSPERRTVLHDELSPLGRGGPLENYRFLSSAFRTPGSGGADYVTVWLFWHRAIASWMEERMHWLAQLPPQFDSFVLIKSVESLGKTYLATCWQSDWATFQRAVADTRSSLAPITLERSANEALAKATTAEQAKELLGWMDQGAQKELAQYAPADLKEKLGSRLIARADELISKSIADEESKIAALGQGKEAVLAGNALYHDLQKRFGFADKRPAFLHALKLLQARRDSDLAAAKSAIAQDLATQTTQAALDAKLREYLAVPDDRLTATAGELLGVAEKQRAEIRSKEYLAYFSPNERRWSPQPDGTITVPANVPPPDAEDIRMAWVREFASSFAGSRVGPYKVSFFDITVLTIQPAHLISVGPEGNGFVCHYTIAATPESSDSIKRVFGTDSTTATVQTILQTVLALTGEDRVDRFELGSHGWYSPTAREKMSKNRGF
jgi:hypothetical protein